MLQLHLSKSSLLSWVKETTKLQASQLQDLSTGVHFCVLLHHLTLGKFLLNKVNYKAKLEYQSLHNLKLLQYGLENNGILNKFEINKIATKKIKVILQILQWFRKEYIRRNIDEKRTTENAPKIVFKVTKPSVAKETANLPPKKVESQNFQETEKLIKSLRKVEVKEVLLSLQAYKALGKDLPKGQLQENSLIAYQTELHNKERQMQNKDEIQVQKFPLSAQDITFGDNSIQLKQNADENIPLNENLNPQEIKYPKLSQYQGSTKDQKGKDLMANSAEKIETTIKSLDKEQHSHKKKSILKVQSAIAGDKSGNTSTSGNKADPHGTKADPHGKSARSGPNNLQSREKSVPKVIQRTAFNAPPSVQKPEERRDEKNEDKSKSMSKYSNLLSSQDTNTKARII